VKSPENVLEEIQVNQNEYAQDFQKAILAISQEWYRVLS